MRYNKNMKSAFFEKLTKSSPEVAYELLQSIEFRSPDELREAQRILLRKQSAAPTRREARQWNRLAMVIAPTRLRVAK